MLAKFVSLSHKIQDDFRRSSASRESLPSSSLIEMPMSIAVFANLPGMLQCLPSGPICGEYMAIEDTFLCVLLEI